MVDAKTILEGRFDVIEERARQYLACVAAAREEIGRWRRPAQVIVYYVIALTLYMQVSYREVLRCLLEGVKWLL